jgi:hypothetical protein
MHGREGEIVEPFRRNVVPKVEERRLAASERSRRAIWSAPMADHTWRGIQPAIDKPPDSAAITLALRNSWPR